MRVEFRPGSLQDLERIADWYQSQGGASLTREMVDRIEHKAALLEDNPYIAPEYELFPGVRRLVVAEGLFLIFYRVNQVVEILHIRRSEQQDWVPKDASQT